MCVYIGVYLWSILTSVLLKIRGNVGKIIFLISNFVPLCFFAAFRSVNVGTDLPMYIRYFSSVDDNFSKLLEERFEIGYAMLNYLIKNCFDSEIILLLSIAVITYTGIFFFFYKCSSNISMSIITFIGLFMYCASLNEIRQYISISFLCLAFYCIYTNKKIRYSLGSCILAMCFQKSSIIMIPVIYAYRYIKDFTSLFKLIIMSSCLLVMITNIYKYIFVIFPKYNIYEGLEYTQERALTATVFLPIIGLSVAVLSIFFLYRNRSCFDKLLAYYSFLIILYSYSWIASFKIYVFYRVAHFFEVFLCIAIPYIVNKLFKQRELVYVFLTLIMGIYLILHLGKNTAMVVPYLFNSQLM